MRLKKLFFATLFIVDASVRAKLIFFSRTSWLQCSNAKCVNGFLSYYCLMLIFYRDIWGTFV
jgi:hypothetical protein